MPVTKPRRPGGRAPSHAERRAAGQVLVQAYLEPEDAQKLDALARLAGSKTAAIVQLIRRARIPTGVDAFGWLPAPQTKIVTPSK